MVRSGVTRSAESQAVTAFLDASARRPSVLVVEGDPGIGKTTVWLEALEQARQRNFHVLSARAGQAESGLTYAVLADLLERVDGDVLDTLPHLQRVAIDRVLLQGDGSGPATNERVVASAFMTLVERLAIDAPVIVAVDDVQWLDSSSQAVIAFATRRFKQPHRCPRHGANRDRGAKGRRMAEAEQTRRCRAHHRCPAQPWWTAEGDLQQPRPLLLAAHDRSDQRGLRRQPVLCTRAGQGHRRPVQHRRRCTAGLAGRSGALAPRAVQRGHPDGVAGRGQCRRANRRAARTCHRTDRRARRRTARSTGAQRHRTHLRKSGAVFPSTPRPGRLRLRRTLPSQADAPHPRRRRRAAGDAGTPPGTVRIHCGPVDPAGARRRCDVGTDAWRAGRGRRAVDHGDEPRWRHASASNPMRRTPLPRGRVPTRRGVAHADPWTSSHPAPCASAL